MSNIRLSDGTVYHVDRCNADAERLRFRLIDLPGDGMQNMADAILVFCDPEKTAAIVHYFDGTDTSTVYYQGYTALESVSNELEGITVVLRKE